jgi:hypothetical protein
LDLSTNDAMRVGLALAAGLTLTAIAVSVTLTRSPMSVEATNRTAAADRLALTHDKRAIACQAGETLPAGTTAVRLTLKAVAGPRVRLRALAGRRLLTHGVAASGWTGGAVTVPVATVTRAASHVRICFMVDAAPEDLILVGEHTPAATAALGGGERRLPGRLRIEYLRPRAASWWSYAPTVARRIGLGRAWSGTWIVLATIVLTGALVAGACWLAVRELR